MSGFGKGAGPAPSSSSQPRFGPSSSSPPSPSFPHLAPRGSQATERVRSPPLAYQCSDFVAGTYQSTPIPKRPDASQKMRLPPLAFEPAHPSAMPPYPSVGSHGPIEPPSRWVNRQTSVLDDAAQMNQRPSSVTSFVASRNSGISVTAKVARFQDLKRTGSPPSHSIDGDISRNSSQTSLQSPPDFLDDNGNHSVPLRTRSPASVFENNNNMKHVHPPPPFGEAQRPALSPSARNNLPKFPGIYPNLLAHQVWPSVSPYVGSHDTERSFTNEVVDVHDPKQTSLPPANDIFLGNTRFVQKEYKESSKSPPRLGSRSNAFFSTYDSQIPQRPLPPLSASAEDIRTRTTSFPSAKRTRSPPLPSVDEVSQGHSYSSQDGTEREMQAKAKRLARFKEELSERFEISPDIGDQKVAMSRYEQSMVERQNYTGSHATESGDFTNGNIASEFEGLEASSIISGLCPDMCPESERAERERKGDLDQYERLDGDRNQTSKFLAVKKYNRTAEREANLIRPMPILQKTINYLLNLLDQPYNDRFLGMYNFLWDRMRAIRMDLRMQHIFNQEAITMLEQMIRLHIIAMHELCEYTKGEGFSEGFDAHLNIEQMNKTSVELFQMYDDHRKKGINVPTEKEFRGYYGLLKLDKHPGYKVEPAELSLDLAKMTPQIRQTPEVLFARDVARACRTGNFIAFFRLARKGSYLQACLMHAHFAKTFLEQNLLMQQFANFYGYCCQTIMLRTQALASLHSGLQNNQGLPVAYVAKWLAMEAEDMDSLLQYHGFLIKEFEEPYMVKDGPFLNGDKDYPTKCSKLVHLKKSRRIVEDVSPTCQVTSFPAEATKEIELPKIYKHDTKVVPSTFVNGKISVPEINEDMPDSEVISSPRIGTQVKPTIQKSMVSQPKQDDHGVAGARMSPGGFSLVHSAPKPQQSKLGAVDKPNPDALFKASPERRMARISPWGFSSVHSAPEPQPSKLGAVDKPNPDALFKAYPERMFSNMEHMPLQIVSRTALQEKSPSGKYGHIMEKLNPRTVVLNYTKDEEPPDINQENEDDEVVENYKDEVAQAKLKLILRLWRWRSSKRRELREQRQIVASAALSSLSLGPLIRQTTDQPRAARGFDIDHVMKERYEKHEQSWSRLNVSDVIADILGRRNPDAKCLCWKIILCSQINNEGDKLQMAACSWLFSKLMPSRKDNDRDDDLLISLPGLAIWKKWVPNQSADNLTCCLSVVKDVQFGDLNETVAGASAVLFLVSECIPWNLQKIQLDNLLISIPSGSSLPLLVMSDSYRKEVSDPSIIASELGLHDIDESRISSFLVVSLVGDKQMEQFDGFFCDMRLREGLQWLASESAPQPDLHCIKTHDLVLTCLNPSLDVLEKMSDYEVGPNDCISAFNEALDWSLGEIAAAAKANSGSWPCPDIALLEDFHDEHMLLKWYLPSMGWSSASRIAPLLTAIRDCKLASFPDAMSWLDNGATLGIGIENLRSKLENCLIRYLTESSGMMGFLLAAKEANVMLQRSCRLELRGSNYHIVPKWVMIFRRIFNWRLTSLFSGVFSSAFVLRSHHVNPMSGILGELRLERSESSPYLNQPSLDEVIDASCSARLLGRGKPQPEAFQPPPRTISNCDAWVAANTSDTTESERNFAQDGNLFDVQDDHVTNGFNTSSTEIVVSRKPAKETDKLTKLLEQCNIMQNSIDKKLYIYF